MKLLIVMVGILISLSSCSKALVEPKVNERNASKHACEVLPNLELSKAEHIAEIVILAYSFQKVLPNSLQDLQAIDAQLEDHESTTTNSPDEIERLISLYIRADLAKDKKTAYLIYDFNKRMLDAFKSLLSSYDISLDSLAHADDQEDARCASCIETIMHYYTQSVENGNDLALVDIKPKT